MVSRANFVRGYDLKVGPTECSDRWVHLDTVTISRQIFGDIQETHFSGSKMEVNVHLKNAFQAELETEGSRLTTIFGHPSS